MSRQLAPAETPPTVPPVWPGLPSDLQQQAVRLLAQLAFAQFRQHTPMSTQEIDHGRSTQQSQDSPGPS